MAEQIVPHLAHKGAAFAQFAQHGQHIAGRAAGAGLKQGIALARFSVFRKVYQKLTQSHYIIAHIPFSLPHHQVMRSFYLEKRKDAIVFP